MHATLKLYAGLGAYLPPGSSANQTRLDIGPGTTAGAVFRQYKIPPEMTHLVLLNGIYIKPEDRDVIRLHDGDTLAVWPPVAGG